MIVIVDVDKAVIARYEREGKRFEILVDPYLAWDLKQGKEVNFNELLATFEVFRDVKKGERASEEDLRKVFGNKSFEEIAREIIVKGEVHLTTEQRRKMLESKKQQIAAIISKRAINPQTGAPHPVQRILTAMEEAKVHVDVFKSAEEQVGKIVDEIKKVIPIKIESKKVELRIPPKYSGKVYGKIKSYKVVREEWGNDGSLKVVIEVPAGMLESVLHEFAEVTHGEVESKMVD